jgi:uncharacterized protein DUF4154
MHRPLSPGRRSLRGDRRRIWRWGSIVAALLLVMAQLARAAPERASEYSVKAAFLFHFAQLTTWPPRIFAGADSPLVFCTIGNDPFDGVLDSAVASKMVQGHPAKVLHLKQTTAVESCHLLFVGAQEMPQMSALIAALHGLPILTVGEADEFLKQGGMIDLRSQDDRLRFDVNLEAAQSSNLAFSSTLLSLARKVTR